jgi:deoxycytidylate deaminase
MKCGEPDAIDKALQLGLDLSKAKLYTTMFPCPRCAPKVAENGIKYVVALTHRTKHNGKFDNPLEDSCKIFSDAKIEYETGEPDES